MLDLDRTLAELPHVGALPPNTRAKLAGRSRERTLRRGEALFQEGDKATHFFVILSGAVRLYREDADGRMQVVHVFGPGVSFAEAAALGIGRYPVSCDAIRGQTRVLAIPAKLLREALEGDPQLGVTMVSSMAMSMLRLVERVGELALVGAEARLAHYVLRQPSRRESDGDRVELGMPKKALAARLAMTPETLSRLLRRWRTAGIARSEGNAIIVLHAGALDALTREEAIQHPVPD